MPEVSVLMPVYNTARYIREAVESILTQTFYDFELIALDDGSTDPSLRLLAELAAGDHRMHVMTRENRGLVETRNELLAAASGELIAWMDSDDRSTQERLSLQVARMRNEPELVCLGGCWMITDPDGLPIRLYRFPQHHEEIVRGMRDEISIGFGCSMMRRDVARAVGGFRHPFVISEDFDLCLRLAEAGRVANLPQVILYYRQHLASTVNAGRPRSYTYSRLARQLARERREQGQDRLQRGQQVEVHFENEPRPEENINETQARWAWWALCNGNVQTARKYAWRTVTGRPLSKESWKLAACALRGY